MENKSMGMQEKPAIGTSSEILIGLFEDYSHARQAFETLLTTGLPKNIVQLYPESERRHAASQDAGRNEADHINMDVQRILGTPATGTSLYQKHGAAYAEAVRRGHYLLAVNAQTDEQIDQTAAIMNRFKVIDIEERAAHWEHQGWTGYHENAEDNRSSSSKLNSAVPGKVVSSEFDDTADTGNWPARHPNESEADYHRHWQNAYGKNGGRYEDYDPAYHYGSSMARCARYKGIEWADITPQLRTGWEANHPGTWEKFEAAVRYGAERENIHRH
jgi:hypothetical protein